MADITYTNTASMRRFNAGVVSGKGEGANVKVMTATIELAAASQNDTIKFGRIPSNARIALHSDVYWDDLATAGAPTLDIGLGSVDSNITSDPDALTNGLDVAAAAGNARVVNDIADVGKQAWEYVAGQTTDPGGQLDVYGTIADAATNQTGTISLELMYYFD